MGFLIEVAFLFDYFVYFDLLVVVSVLAYILRRGPDSGLRFKKSGGAKRALPVTGQFNAEAMSRQNSIFKDKSSLRSIASSQPTAATSVRLVDSSVRSLTVYFNYNGHSFEAHEVLGVPAGCNLTLAEEAFFIELNKNEPEAREFLQAAIKALRAS